MSPVDRSSLFAMLWSAKVVRIKHLKVDAKDVTPDKLECPTDHKVDIKPGLDIPEKKEDCCY